MTTFQPRKPAGVPTGGQFSTKTRPAPGYSLGADLPDPVVDDHDLRVDFSPDAIRAHFETGAGSAVDDLTEDQLRQAAENALNDDEMWETYERVLDRAIRRVRDDSRPAYDVGQVVEVDRNGNVITTTHLGDGRTEVLIVGDDGAPQREQHRKDGTLTDRDDGTPAEVVRRADGSVEAVYHYRDGKLSDGANGAPAVTVYRGSGEIARMVHYTDGVMTRRVR